MRGITVGSTLSSQVLAGSPEIAPSGGSSFQARLGSPPSPQAGRPAAPFSGEEILRHAAEEMRSLLRLQYQLANGKNSLISNVMKARHETAKNAISNIR